MIHDFRNFQQVAERENVKIAIVAVPASVAQGVIDHLVDSGIRSILNYAPMSALVQPGVHIRNVDPVVSLQSMTYYLHAHD
jgi:redox-sensing transcriptional repressor